MSTIVYRQFFYSGRVQGVGFRYTVKRIATGYEVTGWVRNLPDGRVEMQVSGEPGEILAFAEAVARSQLADHIKNVEQGDIPPPSNRWSGFEIQH